ncbi:MAG: hypothetical protein KDD35_06475 [Bdellovibrionales bacterium]|nr:hypothetical protein [Bdellovibrionales bacterium]
MSTVSQVDYTQLEAERLANVDLELQKELESRVVTTGGGHNTLRQVVLRLVTEGNYSLAEEEIKVYMEFRSNFPSFIVRCQKYVEHCRDLIQAISAKRQFRGVKSLSMSKQQEFHDKVIEHFDELKGYLKQIEMVEREVRLEDIRSTVWVIQTFSQCVLVLLVLAFFLDMKEGMASSFVTVINNLLNDSADWFVGLF